MGKSKTNGHNIFSKRAKKIKKRLNRYIRRNDKYITNGNSYKKYDDWYLFDYCWVGYMSDKDIMEMLEMKYELIMNGYKKNLKYWNKCQSVSIEELENQITIWEDSDDTSKDYRIKRIRKMIEDKKKGKNKPDKPMSFDLYVKRNLKKIKSK